MGFSEIFVQGIGFAAVLVFLLSYQVRSNRKLYLLQTLGNALFCVQFLIMGAYSGCLSLVANMGRNAMLLHYRTCEKVRWKGWIGVLTAVYAAITALTWNGPVSLLPFAAMVGSTAGYWTDNARSIRLSNLLCASPCWLAYDALIGSWGGVVSEAITLASILVSIARYGWKALGDRDSGF